MSETTPTVGYVVSYIGKYYLPADLDERQAIYGTTDPQECLAIDFDNDPAACLLEFIEAKNAPMVVLEIRS